MLSDVSEKLFSIIEHCLEFINMSNRLCMLTKTALILSKLEFALLHKNKRNEIIINWIRYNYKFQFN